MFLNNVHKGVVITYEKAITISVITIIGLLLAVSIFYLSEAAASYTTAIMLSAIQQVTSITEACSANTMTKYILPIHTITTNYM